MFTFVNAELKAVKKQILILTGIILSFNGLAQLRDNSECRGLYNSEKFQEAYECYQKDKDEIFSVYMAAYLAKFLDDKKGFKSWKKHLMKNFEGSETYFYGANLYPTNSKDYLKIVNKGLKKYEKDTLLLESKVDHYTTTKEYDEGIAIVDELIDLMQNDLPLLLKGGYLEMMAGRNHKAIPYYEKALKLDSDNYDANYGIGSTWYNEASDLIQKANSSQDDDEKERLDNEAKSLLKKALPFLEGAFSTNKTNTDVKSALLTCYRMLGMEEEYIMLKNN